MFPYIILIIGMSFLSLNGAQVAVNKQGVVDNLPPYSHVAMIEHAQKEYGPELSLRDMQNFRSLTKEQVRILDKDKSDFLLKCGYLAATMCPNADLLKEIIGRLYEISPETINKPFSSGNNLLILLVQLQKTKRDIYEAIRDLVDKFGDQLNVNTGNKENMTPLHFAVAVGGQEGARVIRLLAKHPNIELDSRKDDGQTPLALAAAYGDSVSMEALLTVAKNKKLVLDVDNKANDGSTPLIASIMSNYLNGDNVVVKTSEALPMTLIKWGANPQACNREGLSPLFLAFSSGKWSAAKFLMEHYREAGDYIVPTYNQNMLHAIVHFAYDRRVMTLDGKYVLKPQDISSSDEALTVKKLAVDLLKRNPDLWSQCSNAGIAPIHYAVAAQPEPTQSAPMMVQTLLKAAQEAKVKDYINVVAADGGHTMLHAVATMGNSSMIDCILQHNPNLTIKNSWGETALDLAREHRNLDIVAKLEALMFPPKKTHKKKRQQSSISCAICGSTTSCCCASSSSTVSIDSIEEDIPESFMNIVGQKRAPLAGKKGVPQKRNNSKPRQSISVQPPLSESGNFLWENDVPENVIVYRQKDPSNHFLIGYTGGRKKREIKKGAIGYGSNLIKLDLFHAFAKGFDGCITGFGLKITPENEHDAEHQDILNKYGITIRQDNATAYVFPGRIECPTYKIRQLKDEQQGPRGAFVILTRRKDRDHETAYHRQFHADKDVSEDRSGLW